MAESLDLSQVSFERLLLPEGVPETLPPTSWQLECARRDLLDLYWRWGFDLVRPPLIEYLDSLLTGAGADLDLQTFKLTDQVNGRTLGVRSDMTTQIARIDAQRFATTGSARYCYIGSVLHTRTEEPGGSRAPLQIGAEKFGDASLSADVEILSLMLESLRLMGIVGVGIDLGHVQVYRRLVERAKLDVHTEARLFDIVQRKSRPDLDALVSEGVLDTRTHARFAAVIDLNGDSETLARARQVIGGIDNAIDAAIEELASIVGAIQRRYPERAIFIDFAELRGYRYKTGLLFAAFAPGHGRELARGGRYDNVGEAFGHGRPATGFSADLNVLAALGEINIETTATTIVAPMLEDEALDAEIARLRNAGWRVVVDSDDSADPGRPDENCAYRLVYSDDDTWQLAPITGVGE
ncbi:ATP phosphoribosyltransferase regulatory subunit [Salinisphaera sp. USBA-960]|uniref:ATP phosphoribosyltransferase regulatory subunit n=1 Tax=Salinisphaera orenii TaxID=856731 RepID=UPI000DBE7328|nr:ATP phosphoribosyltransferase regulatory subunit [Salifodinibacter halophilus]NNC26059.1 ATP phosphoribosyltransferase regulatory subunit [Salifodinibacter halophilus]